MLPFLRYKKTFQLLFCLGLLDVRVINKSWKWYSVIQMIQQCLRLSVHHFKMLLDIVLKMHVLIT